MSTEPDIDWKYWQKLPELKVFEAIALLHGREPEDSPPEDGEADPNYRKTLRLLTASLSNRKFFSPGTLNLADSAMHGVRLLEVAKWAVENGYVLPPGFPVQQKLSIHPPNISSAPAPISPSRGGSSYIRPAITAKTPEWDFWRAMQKAKEWQACALSLNIDPDSMKGHSQAWMAGPDSEPLFTSDSFPSTDVQVKFAKRFRLLRANRYNRAVFTQSIAKHSGLDPDEVLLSEFAAWGLSIAWNDMPPELVAIAKPVSLLPIAHMQPVQPSPVTSAEEWSALVEQEEEARKDPVYRTKYTHAMSLYDERDKLLEQLRQDHPHVDIAIKKRLSEIRAELETVDKIDESPLPRNDSPSVHVKNQTPAPMQRTAAQDAALLAMLKEKGFDPLALPPNEAGKPGVKSLIRQALGTSGLWAGTTVFDKAWERLSQNRDIAYKD